MRPSRSRPTWSHLVALRNCRKWHLPVGYVVSGAVSGVALAILLQLRLPRHLILDFFTMGSRAHVTALMALPWALGGAAVMGALGWWLQPLSGGKNGRVRWWPVFATLPLLGIVLPWLVLLILMIPNRLWGWVPPLWVRTVLRTFYPPNEWGLFIGLASAMAGVAAIGMLLPPWPARWRLQRRWALAAVWGLCALFIGVFAVDNVRMMMAGHVGYHDVGFASECLWNTLHGRFMFSSNFKASPLIADHFAPMVLALLPAYAVYPDIQTLCVATAVALGLCIPLTWRLALRYSGSPAVGVACALAVFWYAPLTIENVSFSYGFQTEHLALPFLLAAFYYLPRDRSWTWREFGWLTGWLLGALLCRESVAAIVLMVSVFVFWQTRSWRLALPLMVLALAWAWGIPNVVVPAIRGNHYYLVDLYYGKLGSSFAEVAWYVAMHPQHFFSRLLRHQSFIFGIMLLLPLAGLALRRLDMLAIGAVSLFFLIVPDVPHFMAYEQHYKCTLLPVIILATIGGLVALEGDLVKRLGLVPAQARQGLLLGLVTVAIGTGYLFGEGPWTRSYRPELYDWHTSRQVTLRYLKHNVPEDAIIYASQRVGSQFSNRPHIYVAFSDFPQDIPLPDIAIIDTNYPWSQNSAEEMLEDLSKQPGYARLEQYAPFTVLIRQPLLDDPAWRAVVQPPPK